MPINRLAYTKTPASQPASEGMLPASNPSNYGNATTKVINLNNNNWLGDSVVFTVDSAWRYVVHVRNSHNGASSIHIDDVRVYGKNTASYLLCGSGGEGYRFGFGNQEKENDISGVDGGHLTYKYRIHDARLGRFLSVDPLAPEYPWNSTYAFAENRVVDCIDLEGLEAFKTIIKTFNDGVTTFEVMTDESIENNAGVSIRNRIIFNGVELGTTYGEMGVPYLEKEMLNIRFMNNGRLAFDTPDGETVISGNSRLNKTGTNGVGVMQLNNFLVKMLTKDPVGSINFNIPFDGSTNNGVSPGPVILNIPDNIDIGSGQLNVNLNDFTQPNISTITISNEVKTVTSNLVGPADNTTINATYPVSPGDNVRITTPLDGSGSDDFKLNGNLEYKITPR